MAVELSLDKRWDGLGIKSLDDLNPILEKIKFLPQVSEDIRDRFERVKSTIRFSFYDYDQTDVAMDYSLLTLELAIKKRYLELEGTDSGEKRFARLIDWGYCKNLFEAGVINLRSLKELRNISAHPRRYSLSGYLAYEPIIATVNVVNGMYEDTTPRRERKKVQREVNRSLRALMKNGAYVKIGEMQARIFLARLLYVENRFGPAVYHFAFWPVFDIPSEKAAFIDEGTPILVSATNYKFRDNGMELIVEGGDDLSTSLAGLENSDDISSFGKWDSGLREHRAEVSYIESELARIRYLLYIRELPN